jgi:predicted GNAT superfamily acetyltransferase
LAQGYVVINFSTQGTLIGMKEEMANNWQIRVLDTIDELHRVEELQRLVWPGSDTDVVPAHLLITAVHNGGFVLGAFPPSDRHGELNKMAGFVFGFPGLYSTPDGPRPKHCSHMLAVHPDYRGQRLGFSLKRAQWQMVRHQGIDRITWTYDPLLSRNAHLNIGLLGAVSNTYLRELYGEMRDGLNIGLPSDRFEVDWWVNTQRVQRRLSKKARRSLDLAHFFAAGAEVINPAELGNRGWPIPVEPVRFSAKKSIGDQESIIVLVEIPADFLALKEANIELAREWRLSSREIFENLFEDGYLVTDFVHLPGENPRSYYVFSHGEGTL